MFALYGMHINISEKISIEAYRQGYYFVGCDRFFVHPVLDITLLIDMQKKRAHPELFQFSVVYFWAVFSFSLLAFYFP